MPLVKDRTKRAEDYTLYTNVSSIVRSGVRLHTRSPLSDCMSIMVKQVSYKIALPTFLLVSVFVAT